VIANCIRPWMIKTASLSKSGILQPTRPPEVNATTCGNAPAGFLLEKTRPKEVMPINPVDLGTKTPVALCPKSGDIQR
jgi:hypothetical protein